jgi:anti-sigma factor ChrR (cupin superfamily)
VVSPGVTVLRPRGLEWTAFALLEGVEIKVLSREENGLYRAVLRLAAGAEIPRHKHKLDEDIVVLEGSLVTDGVTMRAGELCHSEVGSIHAASVAPSGCTLLVIGAEKNEIFWD